MEHNELRNLNVENDESVLIDTGKLKKIGNTKTKDELIKQLKLRCSNDFKLPVNLHSNLLVSEKQVVDSPNNSSFLDSTKRIELNIINNCSNAKWEEGDIIWAKVTGHPWWPGIVGKDFITNTYVHNLKRKTTIRQIHIYYMGIEHERGWVNESSTMIFKGRADLDIFYEKNLLEMNKKKKNIRKMHNVSAKRKMSWEIAVEEAENALDLSKSERLDKYSFKNDAVRLSSNTILKVKKPSMKYLKRANTKKILVFHAHAHKKLKKNTIIESNLIPSNIRIGIQRSGRTVKPTDKIVSLMKNAHQKSFTEINESSVSNPSVSNQINTIFSTPQKQNHYKEILKFDTCKSGISPVKNIDFVNISQKYSHSISNNSLSTKSNYTKLSDNMHKDFSTLNETSLSSDTCLDTSLILHTEIKNEILPNSSILYEKSNINDENLLYSLDNKIGVLPLDEHFDYSEIDERRRIKARRKFWLKHKARTLNQNQHMTSTNFVNENPINSISSTISNGNNHEEVINDKSNISDKKNLKINNCRFPTNNSYAKKSINLPIKISLQKLKQHNLKSKKVKDILFINSTPNKSILKLPDKLVFESNGNINGINSEPKDLNGINKQLEILNNIIEINNELSNHVCVKNDSNLEDSSILINLPIHNQNSIEDFQMNNNFETNNYDEHDLLNENPILEENKSTILPALSGLKKRGRKRKQSTSVINISDEIMNINFNENSSNNINKALTTLSGNKKRGRKRKRSWSINNISDEIKITNINNNDISKIFNHTNMTNSNDCNFNNIETINNSNISLSVNTFVEDIRDRNTNKNTELENYDNEILQNSKNIPINKRLSNKIKLNNSYIAKISVTTNTDPDITGSYFSNSLTNYLEAERMDGILTCLSNDIIGGGDILDLPSSSTKTDINEFDCKPCHICEKVNGKVICCEGPCLGTYHLSCLGLIVSPTGSFTCDECSRGIHSCFICKIATRDSLPCSFSTCGRYYHRICLNELKGTNETTKLICPMHNCRTCMLDNVKFSGKHNKNLYKCIQCPRAYHKGNFCLPAGSQLINRDYISCDEHLLSKDLLSSKADWCNICFKVDDSLFSCSKCPLSYHASCIKNKQKADNGWHCKDCLYGKCILYGDIVWVKIGTYRWLAGQLNLLDKIPENMLIKRIHASDILVTLFEYQTSVWINKNRIIKLQEGDYLSTQSPYKTLMEKFNKGLNKAYLALRYRNHMKIEYLSIEESKNSKKPFSYKHIKTNIPLGDVEIVKLNHEEIPICQCDPKSENVCGPNSHCINRLMMYECHPAVCPARDNCCNQMFVKRLYADVNPRKTENCGWGLYSNSKIMKGDFIGEYVGDLINLEECKRRLLSAQINIISNFYMLTLDKNRIIDAGPKGNYTRFINHSCEPNCETQKWMVNGDVRVGIFALKDIPQDTELTFNYNLDSLGNEKKSCHCGSTFCSGFLGVKPKTSASVQNQKRLIESKLKKKILIVDNLQCFSCGKESNQVIKCEVKRCDKAYHLNCIDLLFDITEKFQCARHFCCVCKTKAAESCLKCTRSYCTLHITYLNVYNNEYLCDKHFKEI